MVGAHAPTQLWHDVCGLRHRARGRGQGGAKDEEDKEYLVKIFPVPMPLSLRGLEPHFTTRIHIGKQVQPTKTFAPRYGPRGPEGGTPVMGSITSLPPEDDDRSTAPLAL
jgi:hypothetical protein